MPVYLIHFDHILHPNSLNRHYIGFAHDVEARVKHHHNGTSKVRMFEVAKERGIGFQVVRIWQEEGKEFERWLKSLKNAPRKCPICQAERKKLSK